MAYPCFTERAAVMKNPFMSMFLSAANKIAGSARAQATASVKRETAKNARQITKAWADAAVPTPPAPPPRKPRKKKAIRK